MLLTIECKTNGHIKDMTRFDFKELLFSMATKAIPPVWNSIRAE